MVKKPDPSFYSHPLKVYSKKFNLLRPGTGIRFTPREKWGRSATPIAQPLRLLFLMLLLGGAAALYFNLPVPPPAHHITPRPAATSPRIMREESVTAINTPVVSIPERITELQTAKTTAIPETGSRWRIRFGIFLLRENADRYAQSLAKKGIITAIETAIRPANAFTLKAGPANDPVAWKNMKSTAAKLNVAPIEEVDGKYVVVGPIWLKDSALAAEKTLKASGFQIKTVEERKEREMFKVLSTPFDSAEAAKRSLGEMQTNGIEGVIDE